MSEAVLKEQIEAINRAFHQIWYAVMFNRPDYKSGQVKKLSFIEMHLLGMAEENPGMILKEFREYLRVPQTTFSSIVKKLEQLGLVRRVINPRDLRSFSLKITEAGSRIVETHRENDLKQAREILLELDEKERGDFVRLFEKAVHRMVQQPVEGSE